jgi:pimeloyl-ACP methyl ester carboxylesterase
MRLALGLFSIMFVAQMAMAQSVRTTYVRLESASALLMEPINPGPKSHIALVYTYPGTSLSLTVPPVNNFNEPSGLQLAGRGYRELLLNHNTSRNGYEPIAPAIGQAIKYLRSIPGVDTVLIFSHSIGGPLAAFYQNVAENGAGVCQGPEKLYPCRGELTNLPKADGMIFTDVHLGEAFRFLSYVDPAVRDEAHPLQRHPALDMFAAINGYNSEAKSAVYTKPFTKEFFAAQAARNEKLVAAALARLSAIERGQGKYKRDEPFDVPELSARLLQPDVRLVSRTRNPHPLLKADGTTAMQIVPSVRPPMGQGEIGAYEQYTVRGFLAGEAIRTTPDYMMTENSITGVDWGSSATSAPSNVAGIKVPVLIMTMTCHYFVVPDEILFEHTGSKDKQLVYVEGASHGYTPCRPEYGDTMKRTFDYIDTWLSEGKRFPTR